MLLMLLFASSVLRAAQNCLLKIVLLLALIMLCALALVGH